MTKKKTAKKRSQGPVRSPFSPRIRVHPERGEESMTKQSFAPECHMGVIMRKFIKTGELPVSGREPQYGDQPEGDFVESQFALARLKTQHEESGSDLPFGEYMQELAESLTPDSDEVGETSPSEDGDSSSPADTGALGDEPKAEGDEVASEASKST